MNDPKNDHTKDRKAILFVITNMGIIVVITILMCCVFCAENDVEENDIDTESISKIGQAVGHIMNIDYCYSCGYKKVYDDYAGIIQQKYPEISVIGNNYDPPGFNMYLSRFIGLGKMVLIMAILSGFNIFAWLNKPQPFWWNWCLENKLYACMMLFFTFNMLEGIHNTAMLDRHPWETCCYACRSAGAGTDMLFGPFQ
ncbi:jg16558 [Pararge aegeria aegeria]|uniref:Jg16558 protein n=1 Tax=Pararge aegeria aegeria TaxID=348720 RepID=A0A8S4RMI3_9NEOP|nr:jg16558 [Pararge aegeria aegeria]